MLGMVVRTPHTNGALGDRAREHGLLTVVAGENVLRLLPPLTIREAEVEVALAALDSACADLQSGGDG
jgi:acetylornithine/N-succinyldiaminopimelate aminotransferase